ncbi:GerAB/ArcD/ProY family transporter [Niallia sp. 01092]|uniref:GerAB/ArcD/ProY family transporter n=1 Tax=unclassified Niallia TaxID=2837522 RepID=UPI003FD150B1
MESAKITSFQLFCLIILFELGTAIMVPLGLDAKQDAWIAILTGMVGGILIFCMYAYLYSHFPQLLLTGYVRIIFGKYIGLLIAILYILFFLYGAARDLRDGVELLALSYDETPISVLSIILMMVISYALYRGIEVLARTGELYFLFFLFTGTLAPLFLMLSNVVDVDHVLPILENGWKPIFSSVYKQTVMFPFGEIIGFTMILPYLNNRKAGFKIGITAIICSGVILSAVVFLEISVLGLIKLKQLIFPFLSMMQQIQVGGFIQRLDAFVEVSLIINDFFKVAVFFYAALIGCADLFNVSKNKLVIPLGVIICVTSIFMAEDIEHHFMQGEFVLKYIFPIFAVVLPFLLMIVEMIRKNILKRNS